MPTELWVIKTVISWDPESFCVSYVIVTESGTDMRHVEFQ